MSWNSFDLCSYSFCPYGDKAFLNRESLSCGPSMPPGLCLILWCCTSGWACLYWRLASDWWGSKPGVGGGGSNGPAGRLAMQPLVGCDSEHSTGTTHWQAHNIMLKGMTCLASGFEKCQKSVYKQCTSPAITGFRRLTGSSGRERSPEVVVRSLAGQGVLWRVPVQLCHSAAERGEVRLSITICPFEGNCSFVVGVVIELKTTTRDYF